METFDNVVVKRAKADEKHEGLIAIDRGRVAIEEGTTFVEGLAATPARVVCFARDDGELRITIPFDQIYHIETKAIHSASHELQMGRTILYMRRQLKVNRPWEKIIIKMAWDNHRRFENALFKEVKRRATSTLPQI